MLTSTHYILVNNKKYEYKLKKLKKVIQLTCAAANINQKFLPEDIPNLIIDLPHLILEELAHKKSQQNETIRFRISSQDKKEITKKALASGYTSISAYLRAIALKAD